MQGAGALNVPGPFTGKVNNSANLGKTTDEIVHLWNTDHPDDPIVFAAEPEPMPAPRNY